MADVWTNAGVAAGSSGQGRGGIGGNPGRRRSFDPIARAHSRSSKTWRQEMNTRTIALVALIIAVIVLVILLT
jgi:hypothetical protein